MNVLFTEFDLWNEEGAVAMNMQFQNNKIGSSLVEVLVTISVLAFGILIMIQMFPSGFTVVKTAEQRTVGAKLAQSEIDKWVSQADNLPDGLLPVDDNGNIIDDYPIAKRGAQLSTFQDNGAGGLERGNVLNLRMVMGESVSISEASFFETADGTTFGSRYLLAYGPVDTFYYQDAGGVTLLHNFAVKSQDMRRVPEFMRLRNASQYSIDYGGSGTALFNIAFLRNATSHDQVFYITYSYWANNGTYRQMVTKVNQEIVVPPGYEGSWISVPVQDVPDGYTYEEMLPFMERVNRGFRLLQGSDTWSDDPYEFILSDPLLGLITFNPKARTQAGGRAKVDYLIYDPRIMAEDVVVPQASTTRIAVKLPLRFILDARTPNIGDGMETENPDEPTFEGLMRMSGVSNTGDPIPQLGTVVADPGQLLVNGSILVIDVSTGLLVDPESVDFGQGIVYINSQSDLRNRVTNDTIGNINMAGRRIRIYYRASGDWTLQMSKAFARYTRSFSGAVNFSQFMQHETNPRRLYFSKLYAGQTVLVDYTYGGNEENKVSGENYRISDDYSEGYCYVDLKDVPDKIYAVVGASVKARVMWRDSYNWRLQDSESLIMRPNVSGF